MASKLAMIVSYAAVIMSILIIGICIEIMRLEQKIAKEKQGKGGGGWEVDEGIAWLTVVSDKRKDKRTASLRGATYSLGISERLGSGSKADTLIKHPAVEKLHVSLTYKKPGKILVKKIKNAVVSTSRKEGELMDGDKLILGEGENRIELQLSFIEHSDITAADSRDERSDEPRKAKRMPGR